MAEQRIVYRRIGGRVVPIKVKRSREKSKLGTAVGATALAVAGAGVSRVSEAYDKVSKKNIERVDKIFKDRDRYLKKKYGLADIESPPVRTRKRFRTKPGARSIFDESEIKRESGKRSFEYEDQAKINKKAKIRRTSQIKTGLRRKQKLMGKGSLFLKRTGFSGKIAAGVGVGALGAIAYKKFIGSNELGEHATAGAATGAAAYIYTKGVGRNTAEKAVKYGQRKAFKHKSTIAKAAKGFSKIRKVIF